MSNTANSKPAPATFALDYHTRQFFDPAEWDGAVEARFYLDTPGLIGREYVGRIANLCSGEYVIVMQEIGGDGEVLLKRPPYSLRVDEAEMSKRADHWGQWLGLIKNPRLTGCPLPILPNLSANFGLSRLHFDAASGFGAQVCSQGHGYLYDLRDVESAGKRHQPHFDLAEFVGKDGMRTLGRMTGTTFHAALSEMFGKEWGNLYHVLRFYSLRDDERSMEVFGCDYASLRRTMKGLRLALTMAMGTSGAFEGCKRASWHPWHHNQSEAIALNRSEHWWEDIPAPQELAHLMERVCAATGCHLRLERLGVGEQEGAIGDARAVAQEWANEFHVRAQSANSHEVMEAGVQLREILDEGN